MFSIRSIVLLLGLTLGGLTLSLITACVVDDASAAGQSDFGELVQIFDDFREVEEPDLNNGVPDYSPAAIAEQKQQLDRLRGRLEALDITGWPIPRQSDYHLVRAEINGLEFHHRVIRPWATDADFYTPRTRGWGYRSVDIDNLPLDGGDLLALRNNLESIPSMLEQGRANIDPDEAKSDGALLALISLDYDGRYFDELKPALGRHHPDLVPLLDEARSSMGEYEQWIGENRSRMTVPTGVGKENYTWWMQNVWLMPYTWQDAWILARREYGRTVQALKVAEFKNVGEPELNPVLTKEDFDRQWAELEAWALEWAKEKQPFTVPDELVAIGPRPFSWEDHPGREDDPLPFFLQLADRDPMMEIIHNTFGHNFDRIRSSHDDRPISGTRRLYNLYRARAEAGGFMLEEMMSDAGVTDYSPRAKEPILVAAAYRAVRAMADLKLHANEMGYQESAQFEAEMTPRGWASAGNFTLWQHRRDYPREPGNEMSYLVGKVQVQATMADQAMQLGDDFSLQNFWDEFFAAGLIPVSLIRWEMTGLEDEVELIW